ncbi:hypothetical protein BSK54_08035 [Paenibacillus odorifer]|jgi:hypothetical protein|uniref:hypothetical protein n=1 Tax=Paenibacillus odorifer TaxID=189426 RepID=UPI00096DED98|nr:hypothetical protein [Paenibacillus odorifer]OME03391.1 hypothetical protein BSK54_08035 [Paenibacillus odorifer]
MFFFFFDICVDPDVSVIENLLGETILLQRQYHCYQTHVGQIAHYYALTVDSLYDLSIAEDSNYSRIFARYDRSIMERDNYFPGARKPLERIFDKSSM